MEYLEVIKDVAAFALPAIVGVLLAKYYQKKKPKISSDGKVVFKSPGYYKILGILTFPFFTFITIMFIIEGVEGFDYVLLLAMVCLISISVWIIYWSLSNTIVLDKNKLISSQRLFQKNTTAHLDQLESVNFSKLSGNYLLKFTTGKKISFSNQFIGRKYLYQILINEQKRKISPKALKYMEKELNGEITPMM